MVTNAPPEFYKAKEKFEKARTPEEKLISLYEMLRTAPKHKGAQNLLKWITKEIAKYKGLLEKQKKKSTKKKPLLQKTGDLLISILGIENSGKSYFLRKFTNAKVEVSEIPFTTKNPAIGTIFYKGVYYQFVEIPSTFDSEFRSILSISDYYILLLKHNEDLQEQINKVNEFSAGIVAFSFEDGENYTVIINKFNDFSDIKIEQILENIIKKLKLIRVFPMNSNHAILLKENSTIEDFIKTINKSWISKFRYAKVIRNNKIIKAGLNYLLRDLDIVEIKIK